MPILAAASNCRQWSSYKIGFNEPKQLSHGKQPLELTHVSKMVFRRNRSWFIFLFLLVTVTMSGCTGEPSASPNPTSALRQATEDLSTPVATLATDQRPLETPVPTAYPTYTPYQTYTPFPAPPPTPLETSTFTVLGIPQELEVSITRVIDGDTFEIELSDGNKEVVRLLAVDTPETRQPNKPNEYAGITDVACLDLWGHQAAEFATIELEGKTVKLVLEGRTLGELISFGRLLAFVIKGGENFNALLIEQGLARVFTEKPNSKEAEFLELQQQAQTSNAGLWVCRDSTPIASSTTSPTPTPTPTPALELATPSPTLAPHPTQTPTPTPTAIPTPLPTPTSPPTPTSRPVITPTNTPGPTPTPPPTSIPAPTAAATLVPPPTPTTAPSPTPEPPPSSVGCEEGKVDVNSASAEELDLIIHIGPVRAAEAVQLRPFSSLDDLDRINGIGPSRLADIKAEGLACVGA